MERPKKITVEVVRTAVAKIKRRKSVRVDADISITMVAKEVGCSRVYLYKDEFDSVLKKYKKQKIKYDNAEEEPKRGSVEYHENISKKKTLEIKNIGKKLDLALENLVDQELLLAKLNELEAENKRLRESNDPARIRVLESENSNLRMKLMAIGMKK